MKILKEKYSSWDYCKDPQFIGIGGYCNASKALIYKGWTRVAGGGNYMVWSTQRLSRNMVDELTTLPEDEAVYIDAFVGEPIYNKAAGYLVEKYQ